MGDFSGVARAAPPGNLHVKRHGIVTTNFQPVEGGRGKEAEDPSGMKLRKCDGNVPRALDSVEFFPIRQLGRRGFGPDARGCLT